MVHFQCINFTVWEKNSIEYYAHVYSLKEQYYFNLEAVTSPT